MCFVFVISYCGILKYDDCVKVYVDQCVNGIGDDCLVKDDGSDDGVFVYVILKIVVDYDVCVFDEVQYVNDDEKVGDQCLKWMGEIGQYQFVWQIDGVGDYDQEKWCQDCQCDVGDGYGLMVLCVFMG